MMLVIRTRKNSLEICVFEGDDLRELKQCIMNLNGNFLKSRVPEERRKTDRDWLSKDPHPCMMEGDFSIFDSPNVGVASTYSLDMDGFVVLSR